MHKTYNLELKGETILITVRGLKYNDLLELRIFALKSKQVDPSKD